MIGFAEIESEMKPVRVLMMLACALAWSGASSRTALAQSDPSGYATQSHTPNGFRLPDGSGCSADIARWQAIQDNDYHGGNIGLPVYHQIQREIAVASSACAAGHDAQASAMIRASRAKHGYPQ